jgi:hypothetical protein
MVDGFRFDLASIFSRASDGTMNVHEASPVSELTLLARVFDVRLVAEAWDIASYQLDSIPKDCMRELRNVIERAVIVATGRQLVVWPPPVEQRPVPHSATTLCALEGDHIHAVLESTKGRIRGVGGAAERLGLKPTTLESRMARLGITRKKMD